MSGSSLDGLDLAVVAFDCEKDAVKYWELKHANEHSFPSLLKSRLKNAVHLSGIELAALDHEFGRFCGSAVNSFLKKTGATVDYIASHGHTVFHFPQDGYTKQIGSPNAMSMITGIPVIADFRAMDMAHGGQGAPLAPVVEHYLYPGYDLFLNLGGIANISLHTDDTILAFDVCPANQILNKLAGEEGLEYDDGGCLAAKGNLNNALFNKLNTDPFLKFPYPKSLDNTALQQFYFPIFGAAKISTEDKLNTAVCFIAEALTRAIETALKKEKVEGKGLKLFVSGGGAYNDFLIRKIKSDLPNVQLELPPKDDINYKEAILMALVGVLRLLEQPNAFASVTGASKDTINGSIYKS